MKRLLVLTVLLFSSLSLAIAERQLNGDVLKNEILSYIKQAGKWNYFKGAGGKSISYLAIKSSNPKGVIILSPGQGEPALKYAEVLFDMRDWGYDIFAIDHRGQGFSDRLLPNSDRCYVQNFSDYVDDFSTLVNEIVKPAQYHQAIIMAHSMGGAIATGYLKKFSGSYGISKAVLLAPMLGINTGFLNEDWARFFANKNPLDTMVAQEPFEKEKLTSSQVRFDMTTAIAKESNVTLGGITFRWIREALNYTKMLQETKDPIYVIPTLLFTAGQDKVVTPIAQHLMCGKKSSFTDSNSGSRCTVIMLDDSQHEILMEVDSIRDRALERIKKFID